jgi:predicted CXXCH cytochrome family protein
VTGAASGRLPRARRGRSLAAAILVFLLAALLAACDATARHSVLTYFFDGVPPLEQPGEQGPPVPGAAASLGQRPVSFQEHGPYAAKMCDACHNAGLGNALVVPAGQLCYRCHELKLDKKYIHGPLASGGCLICHDPHSSSYRPLLVSKSDDFCFSCHDPADVAKNPAHAVMNQGCTTCHDAHMSDTPFLLK